MILWQRPLVSNGPISYYKFCYTNKVTTQETCRTSTTTASRLTDLKPFSIYLLIVRAVNVEGSTELESKSSKQIQFQTLSSIPSQPRQLTATDKQIQSVHLKWQKPSNPNGVIAKYEIIVVQGGGINPSNYNSNMLVINESVGGGISAFMVTGLTELTRYSVWIVAVNIRRTDKAKLTSRPSQVITFATKGGVNTAPQKIMSSQVTSTSALITWQQPLFSTPRSVTRYYIRYFKSTRPVRNRHQQSIRDTKFHLSNLDIYTNYAIYIAAYVHPLWSPYASYNFTTKQAAPSPPQKVKANDIGSRSASMSWTPPLHANGVVKKYRIYIQSYHTSRPNNLNNGNKTVLQSQTAVTIDKLIPFTTYYVWITAINVDGRELESDFEDPTVFETNAEVSSSPREVQWFNVTSHSVIISWRKPAIVNGNVEKYSVSLVSFLKQKIVKKLLAKKEENTFFLFVDNLVPYTQYTVTVQTGTRTKCCSNLLWSDANIDESTVTFTTQQAAPSRPARPNVTNVLSRSCLIKWKLPDAPNGDIQFYLLSLYKKADNNDPLISHNTSNIDTFRHLAKNSTLQIELSSLSPYTSYGAAVTAVNIMNNTKLKSKQSELVNFTTADEKPAAPSMCTVNRRGANFIFMSWQPPEPHDYRVVFYYVKVNSTTAADSKNHSKIVSHLSDNVSNLLPYTEYKITVTAVTNNTKLWEGFPCYLKDKTKVGVPPVPEKLLLPVNMTEKGSTVTVTLPQLNKTNGPIKVVKIIVLELKPNTNWFENMSLPRADDDRVHAYTTINLTTDQVKEQVVIGSDNYGYGPLKPNTKYAFYVQWISEDEDSTGRQIQLISTSAGIVYNTDSFGSTASSSSSHVTPIVVVLLLVATVTAVVVVIWYRRRKAKKRDLHGQDRYTVQSKDMQKNDDKDTETKARCYEMPSIAQTTRAINALDMTKSNAYKSVTVETSEIASYADAGTTVMQSKVGSLATPDESIIYEEINS